MAEVIAHGRLLNVLIGAGKVEQVVLFVKIGGHEGVEIKPGRDRRQMLRCNDRDKTSAQPAIPSRRLNRRRGNAPNLAQFLEIGSQLPESVRSRWHLHMGPGSLS